MNRFFINNTNVNYHNMTIGSLINLDSDNATHIYVKRIKLNELIELFDNGNYRYTAQLITSTKKSASCKITDIIPIVPNNDIKIKLAISVIAHDKMELIIQKANELNVDTLIPLISLRTQGSLINNFSNKLTRWQNIIIDSCKQSSRNNLLQIDLNHQLNCYTFNEYVQHNCDDYTLKIILSPHVTLNTNSDLNFKNIICKYNKTNIKAIIVIIGPEGGFTGEELKHAISNNFYALTLGNLILRTETAAISVMSMLQHIYNW